MNSRLRRLVDLGFAEAGDVEFLQQLDEVLVMQIIEPRPGPLALTHLVHRRLIARPPAVGERVPILVMALRPEEELRLTGDAVAPIHHRAEHIEGQGLYVGERHRLNFLLLSWPEFGA